MPEDHPTIAEADERVTWMRKRGVVKCWGIELGPEPQSDAADDDETQRNTTPEETEQQRRNARRRLVQLSSGGPVPVVGRL